MKKIITALAVTLCTATTSLSSYAAEDTTGRKFVAETPDAILCIFNNAQKTRVIYRKTSGVKDDLVRYDGPEGFLLHYDLPSGALKQNLNPQPSFADCVYNNMSLQSLIEQQRAYKNLTPMPSGSFLNPQ